jgi:hypothetical protein
MACRIAYRTFQSSSRCQIIRQHTEAKHFILPKLPDVRSLGFVGNYYSLSRLCRYTEVRSQSLCRFIAAEIKHLCRKVDHITFGSAAEAKEIFLIQLQAWMPVIVEWAASHAVAADFQPVVFGGLSYRNCRFHSFKNIQIVIILLLALG